jgi:hypothetical protein
MRFDDTRLTSEETTRLARYIELDLVGNDLSNVDDIQRVLEATARQSGDSLFKRGAVGSDAQFKRIVKAVKAQRASLVSLGIR